MTEFYTRNGDDGFTGLLGEGRVPKYHPRTEAVGEIDEASAALGAARAICSSAEHAEMILQAQRDLYGLMAEVAATRENAGKFRQIDASRVSWLEDQIASVSVSVEIPKEFILPGDTQIGAALALARTVVRRAERRLAHLFHLEELDNQELLHYMNRLSSLCFILELSENQLAGKSTPTLARE